MHLASLKSAAAAEASAHPAAPVAPQRRAERIAEHPEVHLGNLTIRLLEVAANVVAADGVETKTAMSA
jgi:hypothetical protein